MKLFLGFFALCGIASSIPITEDFFLFKTDDGQIVRALLKETGKEVAKGPIEEDVIFWHYLPGNDSPTKVLTDGTGLSTFIRGAPLILCAHGFGSSHTGGFGDNLRNGFAQRGEEVNMIFINYNKRASSPDYLGAVNNLPEVGAYVASLVNYLVGENLASLENTSFIGHSLGAHMANHVTANLEGGKLGKIFGLDPAGPLYETMADHQRLDPSDADFVNVIHTAVGLLGFRDPRGHADFYPNSGGSQPGCPGDLIGTCSHSKAYEFMGESIANHNSFPSCSCPSWRDYTDDKCDCSQSTLMGWDTPITASGNFYLRTNPDRPYSQH